MEEVRSQESGESQETNVGGDPESENPEVRIERPAAPNGIFCVICVFLRLKFRIRTPEQQLKNDRSNT